MLSQDNDLDIQKIMEFLLGPIPWSIATPDGMPTKNIYICLMKNKLEDVSLLQMPAKERHHVHIINGNALFIIHLSYQRLLGN